MDYRQIAASIRMRYPRPPSPRKPGDHGAFPRATPEECRAWDLHDAAQTAAEGLEALATTIGDSAVLPMPSRVRAIMADGQPRNARLLNDFGGLET